MGGVIPDVTPCRYMRVNTVTLMFSLRITFSLRLRTYDHEGIIVATGDEQDYFYIVLREGNLEANIRLEGKGPFPIHTNKVFVSDGQWHHVSC